MIARFQKLLRFTLFSAFGFGIAGTILGFMHTSEDEWMWLLGFAAIGAISGAALSLIIGKYYMLLKLVVAGAAIGALSRWLTSTSDLETWLQMTIMGLLAGVFVGLIIGLFDTEKKKPPKPKWQCEDCGSEIRQSDRFCPGCGAEFE